MALLMAMSEDRTIFFKEKASSSKLFKTQTEQGQKWFQCCSPIRIEQIDRLCYIYRDFLDLY